MSKKHKIRLGKFHLPLPGSALLRIAIGSVLILFGCFGFLPVLGFWMIPVGVVVLSIDLPVARRLRRRTEVWWGNWRTRRKERRRRRALAQEK